MAVFIGHFTGGEGMSLAATITQAVASAFSAVGDLKVTATIKNETGRTYDTSTMTYSDGSPVTDSASVVKYDFKRNEIDGENVRHGDSRFMVQTSELTSNYRDYDKIIEGGRTWEIINDESVPGESIVIYQVRLVNE